MPQAQKAQTAEVNLNEILRQVAREKDIDLERWISALEDAMASAAKKQHRIKEPVRAHLDRETGKFDAFIVKKVVETVEDPLAEWTVEEARDHKPDAAGGRRGPLADLHRRPGTHRRPVGQAGALPAGARGRAREHLQRVHRPGGRGASTARSSASSAATSSSTSGAPRPWCPARSRPATSATARASASAPSSSTCTSSPRGRRSCSRAPTRGCWSSSSRPRCRRSTTARW